MPFSGGTYTLPGPALNTGDTVSATENNTFRNDVAGAFNDTLLRDGTSTPTADLPMDGYKLTGLAAGTTNGDSVRYEQLTAATSGMVTETGTQVLTNKTISTDNNTINGVAASSFVISDATGKIDGSAAQKTIPAGDVVGTSDSQTLTNKTISADNNTLSGIAASSFVLSNASGNIDGSAAQKAIPAGAVVGTSDSQTLTNKTISADDNTLSGLAASSFVLSNASGNIDGSASQKAIPSGVVVGTTDTQTLTNKTIVSSINAQTGTTYTLALSDASKMITLSNASSITVTVPPNSSVAFATGTMIDLAQIGAGQVTFVGGSGVTVNATPGLKCRAQYSGASLIKLGTDSWLLVGDLSA